jgi:hypothetical protein
VWDLSSIVWTDPDSRQRNLLLGQKIDFDIAVVGNARPAVGASLTPRAIWRVVGLQFPLFQHPCHLGWETSFSPGSGVWAKRSTPKKEKKNNKNKFYKKSISPNFRTGFCSVAVYADEI